MLKNQAQTRICLFAKISEIISEIKVYISKNKSELKNTKMIFYTDNFLVETGIKKNKKAH